MTNLHVFGAARDRGDIDKRPASGKISRQDRYLCERRKRGRQAGRKSLGRGTGGPSVYRERPEREMEGGGRDGRTSSMLDPDNSRACVYIYIYAAAGCQAGYEKEAMHIYWEE